MLAQKLRDSALAYVQRGWHVFPCKYKSKVPATPNGFKDASLDLAAWENNQEFNIGIATGKVSKLVVVDIDPKHNGPASWEAFCKKWEITPEELNTYRVVTGSLGSHLYFLYPEGLDVPSRIGVLEGVDIKAEGGYVIAPPSVHENGRDYRAVEAPLLHPPAILLATILGNKEKPVPSTGDAESLVVEGARNDYLMRVAGQLRRPGLSEAALSAALLQHNEDVCNPPLPEWEVRRIAQNIAAYEPSAMVQPSTEVKDEPFVAVSELLLGVKDYLCDKKRVMGKPTGLPTLDKFLGGGKRLGEMTAWHAEAKTGKNSLWHKLMHVWLGDQVPIGYASREIDPAQDVLPNLLSLETKTNVWKVECTDEKWNGYAKAMAGWPLYFSKGYGAMSFAEVEHFVRSLHSRGVEYFWFDHLHFMLEDPEDHKTAAKLVKDMKTLAQSLKVHMDIIIQPNRLEEGRKLSMHSLKGGAVINQTVDNLIILERDKEDKNILEVKMELGRSKLVKHGELYLRYDDVTTDFSEVDKVKVPQQEAPYGGRAHWVGARPQNQKHFDFNSKRLEE